MSWSPKRSLLLLSVLIAGLAYAEPGNERFEAAIELAQKGQAKAAAEALVRLAEELPSDPFADDALSEAALLYEQSLHDPQRALALLDQLERLYPQSRLYRRAKTRAERLRLGLQSGQAPLIAYQALLAELSKLTPAQQVDRLAALLVKYPDFSLRDDVRMQLAAAAGRAQLIPRALAELDKLEQEGSIEFKQRARLQRADLLLESGRLDEAGQIDSSATFAQKLKAARWRRALLRSAAVLLAGLFLAALWRLGRSGLVQFLRDPPTESLFYLPIGSLFVLAGLTENRLISGATALLAIGGFVEVTLFAGLARRSWQRPRLAIALLWLALLLSVLSLFVVVIECFGLSGLVLETLRHGPER